MVSNDQLITSIWREQPQQRCQQMIVAVVGTSGSRHSARARGGPASLCCGPCRSSTAWWTHRPGPSAAGPLARRGLGMTRCRHRTATPSHSLVRGGVWSPKVSSRTWMQLCMRGLQMRSGGVSATRMMMSLMIVAGFKMSLVGPIGQLGLQWTALCAAPALVPGGGGRLRMQTRTATMALPQGRA